MRKDPMHLTVCDRCYRGTWYAEEGPCRMSRPILEACGQSHGREGPCGGTLRVIDRSHLAPAFAPYYESGERIRVRFADGSERTGTVSKTLGWRPFYLLILRTNSLGSPWLLSNQDRVIAVKRGTHYVQTYWSQA